MYTAPFMSIAFVNLHLMCIPNAYLMQENNTHHNELYGLMHTDVYKKKICLAKKYTAFLKTRGTKVGYSGSVWAQWQSLGTVAAFSHP